MIKRRKSHEFSIGNVIIGNNNPISVQSMCNTDTRNIQETAMQIQELANAGCELVRLAVLNKDAAEAIKELVKISPVPLIADIHFDYRLAIQCINNRKGSKTCKTAKYTDKNRGECRFFRKRFTGKRNSAG